jgi:long-chain fatty acid transport protein
MHRTAVTVIFASLLLGSSALASGFALRESSASSLGLSYAGAAANGSHASTLTFNPALLGDVKDFDVSSSAIGLLPDTDGTFTATTSAHTPVTGNGNPKDIVNTALIPALGLRWRFTDHFIAGLTVSAPWGMMTDYGTDSVTRYYNIKSDVKTYNITPMIGFQPVPEFTIAGGLQIEYIKGTLTKAIDFGTLGAGYAIPGSNPGHRDGYVALKAQDWQIGYVFGVEWKPRSDLSLGVSFRSELNNTLKGTETFTLDAPQPPYPSIGAILQGATGAFQNGPATAKFTTPWVVTLGAKWQVSDQLTLLAGGDWTGWNSFQNLTAHSSNPHQPDDVTIMNWTTSLSASLGAEYKPIPELTLRLGTAYDETPTVDRYRTPGIPDGSRVWISGGVGYDVTNNITLDFSIARLMANKGNIALVQTDTGNAYRGNLTGSVNLAVTLIGFEVGYHL